MKGTLNDPYAFGFLPADYIRPQLERILMGTLLRTGTDPFVPVETAQEWGNSNFLHSSLGPVLAIVLAIHCSAIEFEEW